MSDFIDTLAMDATRTIDSGYYQTFVPKKQQKISRKWVKESTKDGNDE